MDSSIKTYWLTLPEPRLRNHLTTKLKYPPPVVASILERVAVLRAQRKAKAIKRTVCFAAWDEFLVAPRAELGNIRTMKAALKREGSEGNHRWQALCAYEAVLIALIARLREYQREDLVTPKQLPAWLKEQGKRPPRNDGSHWVDHVPAHIKERVMALFNALPASKRGKTKAPFERTLPLKQFKATRVRLIEEMNTELEDAERLLAVARLPEEVERLTDLIADIHRAQFVLDKYKRIDHLPSTWRGLVS